MLIHKNLSNSNILTDHTKAYHIIHNFILYWEILIEAFVLKINELKINYYLETGEAI